MTFDAAPSPGYPQSVFFYRPACLIALAVLTVSSGASAQSVAFVAVGDDPSPALRRAALLYSEVLAEQDGFDVVQSNEVRRALAGEPATTENDDPLEDVRRLTRQAEGDRLRQSLVRLGERLGLDLLVTLRRSGEEIELRGFDVERSAFYRGTLMVDAMAPVDVSVLGGFVEPRVRATSATPRSRSSDDGDRRRRRPRSRWWVLAVVGGAIAAAALVGYLVQPDPAEDLGVTVRIVAP